jgi:hypothetical protein
MSLTASSPAPAMPVADPGAWAKALRLSIVLGPVFIVLFQAGCAILAFANRISLLISGTSIVSRKNKGVHLLTQTVVFSG